MKLFSKMKDKLEWVVLVAIATLGATQSSDKVGMSRHFAESQMENEDEKYTYNFDGSEAGKMSYIIDLISALGNLEVLTASQHICFSMDKIVKSLETQDSNGDKVWRVGIHLYIQEIGSGKGRPKDDTNGTGSGSSGNSGKTVGVSLCPVAPVKPEIDLNAQNDMSNIQKTNITFNTKGNGTVVILPNKENSKTVDNASDTQTDEVTKTKTVSEESGKFKLFII